MFGEEVVDSKVVLAVLNIEEDGYQVCVNMKKVEFVVVEGGNYIIAVVVVEWLGCYNVDEVVNEIKDNCYNLKEKHYEC